MTTAAELNFRNGFLFHLAGEAEICAPASWMLHDLSGARLWTHPDTNLAVRIGNGRQVALIGECFDPESGIYLPTEMLNRFFDAAAQEKSLLALLDAVAGRFALLVGENGQWRVFHDAIGSRSVFYHKTRRIVASHVGLISKPLGLSYADYFIPFLISPNYHTKDVKYLPGHWTPFEEIRQLTPNLCLNTLDMKPRRYWPRADIVPHSDLGLATDYLASHLRGLSGYLTAARANVFLGLTGGTDSRGLYAALKGHDPRIFTWVRSRDGSVRQSDDATAAKGIAATYGHNVDVWALKSPKLNDANDSLARAFRESTSYYRGIASLWLGYVAEINTDYQRAVFVRGFGGEVLRGFYHKTAAALPSASREALSRAYDINSGSHVTRAAFAEFIQDGEFSETAFGGRDVNDMFYWEHRMGTWGSIAMSEADLAARSLTGYNSRNLFDAFLGLDFPMRSSRAAFQQVVRDAAPEIADIPIC